MHAAADRIRLLGEEFPVTAGDHVGQRADGLGPAAGVGVVRPGVELLGQLEQPGPAIGSLEGPALAAGEIVGLGLEIGGGQMLVQSPTDLGRRLPGGANVMCYARSIDEGCGVARDMAGPGERVLVFGSFLTVGPALAIVRPWIRKPSND